MAILDGNKLAQENLIEIAKLVVTAALKAPQITQSVDIKTEIVTGEDLLPIIEVMEARGEVSRFIKTDAYTFRRCYEANKPIVLILIGADLTRSELNWNCGACGFKTCAEFNAFSKKKQKKGQRQKGPSCQWKVIDFSIACDWACASAYQYGVDNRIQGSSGFAGSALGYLEGCSIILGLPIGPTGNLWWYSKEVPKFTYNEFQAHMFRTNPTAFLGFTGGGYPEFKYKTRYREGRKWMKVEEDVDLIKREEEALKKIEDIVHKKGRKQK